MDHPSWCSALTTLKHEIFLPLRFHLRPSWIFCTSLQTPAHGKYKSVYRCYRSWHLKEISYTNESKVNCPYLLFAIQKYKHNSISDKTKLLVQNNDSCMSVRRKLGSKRNKVLRILLLFTVVRSVGKHVLGTVSSINRDFQ